MQQIKAQEIVPIFNAIIYAVCLFMLGVSLWKALIVALVASACVSLNYGARWVLRGGFVLLVVTMLVWLGVLPPPAEWREMVDWAAERITAAPESPATN